MSTARGSRLMMRTSLVASVTVEVIKLNRSLALMLALTAPVLVAVFTLVNALQADQARAGELWMTGNAFIWASFMLPMSLAALSALMAQMEHGPRTWDYLRALPVPRWTVYAAKALLLMALILFMSLMVPVGSAAALLIAAEFNPALADAASIDLAETIGLFARISLAATLIAALQFWTAMRFSSFVPALALGIGGTFFTLVAHSAEAGIYFPWLMPSNMLVTDIDRRAIALVLGGGLGLGLMILAIIHLAWRTR